MRTDRDNPFENQHLLRIDNLSVSFQMYGRGFSRKNLEVLHSLSLELKSGEILAVAGSSGSGKSILAHAILGLLPGNALQQGNIYYGNALLTKKRRKELLGREIAFIPQSVDYLDPLMKVGQQVVGVYGTKKKQEELFRKYLLPEDTGKKYPHELSGGMARRVLISSAMMGNPRLIIADEPTPGLDVKLAMETLKHFRTFADQGAAVLLITHDIDLALNVADKVAVFYAGTIVEIAVTQDFLKGQEALRHPYSKAFLSALPQNEFKVVK